MKPERKSQTLLYSWILPYFAFLSIWLPWNGFYKLLIWPALVILQAQFVSTNSWLRSRITGISALVVAMFAWNLAAYVYPHSHETSDPVVEIAKRVAREMPQRSSVMFYTEYSVDDWYLRYFTREHDWRKLPPSLNLSTILTSARQTNTSACFETSALSSFSRQIQESVSHLNLTPNGSWEVVSSQHKIRVKCFK